METVDNLKKIKLGIEAGSTPQDMHLTPQPIPCEFIFGIGPTGMSPFECELAGKKAGHSLLLPLKKAELQRFLEHIDLPIRHLFEGRDALYVKVSITEVAAADSREVVRAMAQLAHLSESGCSCGCDGCG